MPSTDEPEAPQRPARWIPGVAGGATLAAVAAWLTASPAARDFVVAAAGHLGRLDVAGLRDLLAPYGDRAWIYTSILMILQSLAAPIPAVPITLCNALIYGPWLGALISWSSAEAAAALCFLLGRAFGRPFVLKLFRPALLARLDGFFARDGLVAVLVLRLIPYVSFDVVSYAGGLTSLRFVPFLLATGLGQAPATLVYSYAGAEIVSDPGHALKLALVFLGAMALIAALIWWKLRARRRATNGAANAG